MPKRKDGKDSRLVKIAEQATLSLMFNNDPGLYKTVVDKLNADNYEDLDIWSPFQDWPGEDLAGQMETHTDNTYEILVQAFELGKKSRDYANSKT